MPLRPDRRRSLLAQRVLGLIGEEWMSGEEWLAHAIPLVPPGKALRAYRTSAARNAAERQARIAAGGKAAPTRPIPPEREQIRMGARSVVNDILGSARDSKLVETEHRANRGDRWLRLNPERRWSHHCCLHGGSCAADPPIPEPAEDDDPAELTPELASAETEHEGVTTTQDEAPAPAPAPAWLGWP